MNRESLHIGESFYHFLSTKPSGFLIATNWMYSTLSTAAQKREIITVY